MYVKHCPLQFGLRFSWRFTWRQNQWLWLRCRTFMWSVSLTMAQVSNNYRWSVIDPRRKWRPSLGDWPARGQESRWATRTKQNTPLLHRAWFGVTGCDQPVSTHRQDTPLWLSTADSSQSFLLLCVIEEQMPWFYRTFCCKQGASRCLNDTTASKARLHFSKASWLNHNSATYVNYGQYLSLCSSLSHVITRHLRVCSARIAR